MISIGIIGGSGYTGKYLMKFLSRHSHVGEISLYANNSSGKKLYDVFPDLNGSVPDQEIISAESLSMNHEAYFIALPHGKALDYVPKLIDRNKLVIDLGGDYRLKNEELYEEWYGFNHSSSKLLNKGIYGLSEYLDDDEYDSNLIANPGCYPTAILLSLLPAVEKFSQNIINISTCAYSGTSGAGKTINSDLSFSEMNNNVRAYNVGKHRHEPEIIQMLNSKNYFSEYSLTTHLLPVKSGIYATSIIYLDQSISENELKQVYQQQYSNSLFVRLRESAPNLSWVINTNFCDINVSLVKNKIIVTSAIDNLIKGASGQAVQNLNKCLGWDESVGIQ